MGAYLLGLSGLHLQCRVQYALMRHHASRVPDSRHLQALATLRCRKREQTFQDVVHGEIGSAAHQEAERFRIGLRTRGQLANDLDESVRLASP